MTSAASYCGTLNKVEMEKINVISALSSLISETDDGKFKIECQKRIEQFPES